MSQTPNLMDWGANFLLWFGPTFFIGAANYWVFHGKQEFLQFFVVTLPLLALLVAPAMLSSSFLLLILGILILSVVQTFLEEGMKLMEGRPNAETVFFRSVLAHLCSLALGEILVLLVFGRSPRGSSAVCGYYMGLLLTPITFSLFRWMLLTAKLRPGLERHFTPEDRRE